MCPRFVAYNQAVVQEPLVLMVLRLGEVGEGLGPPCGKGCGQWVRMVGNVMTADGVARFAVVEERCLRYLDTHGIWGESIPYVCMGGRSTVWKKGERTRPRHLRRVSSSLTKKRWDEK